MWLVFRKSILAVGLSLCFTFSTLGCSNETNSGVSNSSTSAGSSCQALQAQIAVGDGFLRNLCGCAESAGQWVEANSGVLSCTVPVGTTLFISYIGTYLRHQIVPRGTPGFQPSPVSNPKGLPKILTHVVQFSEAGTYAFEDLFNSGLRGEIVVQ
jgi:hypothetical protein